MASQYLIPEPTDIYGDAKIISAYKQSERSYYFAMKNYESHKNDTWWAIGMIIRANDGGIIYNVPLVISNLEDFACTFCAGYDSVETRKAVQFEREGKNYYLCKDVSAHSERNEIRDNTVPICNDEVFTDNDGGYETAAKKLIELYLADGGTLPGEEPEPEPEPEPETPSEYQKVEYTRVDWENKETSLKTPLNATNLNKMDKAIGDLCTNLDAVYTETDTKKLDKTSANKILSETPTWDEKTGVLTFKFFDGTEFSVDFNVEKIPVSFSMDENGVITMTTSDGTKWTADISKIIPTYVFKNGSRIAFTETTGSDGTKNVTADLVKGSITDEYLATDFLTQIKNNVSAANSSATAAATSATNAANDAKLAQSYAIGGSGVRDGEDTDNAKYYAQQAFKNLEYAQNLVIAGEDFTE